MRNNTCRENKKSSIIIDNLKSSKEIQIQVNLIQESVYFLKSSIHTYMRYLTKSIAVLLAMCSLGVRGQMIILSESGTHINNDLDTDVQKQDNVKVDSGSQQNSTESLNETVISATEGHNVEQGENEVREIISNVNIPQSAPAFNVAINNSIIDTLSSTNQQTKNYQTQNTISDSNDTISFNFHSISNELNNLSSIPSQISGGAVILDENKPVISQTVENVVNIPVDQTSNETNSIPPQLPIEVISQDTSNRSTVSISEPQSISVEQSVKDNASVNENIVTTSNTSLQPLIVNHQQPSSSQVVNESSSLNQINSTSSVNSSGIGSASPQLENEINISAPAFVNVASQEIPTSQTSNQTVIPTTQQLNSSSQIISESQLPNENSSQNETSLISVQNTSDIHQNISNIHQQPKENETISPSAQTSNEIPIVVAQQPDQTVISQLESSNQTNSSNALNISNENIQNTSNIDTVPLALNVTNKEEENSFILNASTPQNTVQKSQQSDKILQNPLNITNITNSENNLTSESSNEFDVSNPETILNETNTNLIQNPLQNIQSNIVQQIPDQTVVEPSSNFTNISDSQSFEQQVISQVNNTSNTNAHIVQSSSIQLENEVKTKQNSSIELLNVPEIHQQHNDPPVASSFNQQQYSQQTPNNTQNLKPNQVDSHSNIQPKIQDKPIFPKELEKTTVSFTILNDRQILISLDKPPKHHQQRPDSVKKQYQISSKEREKQLDNQTKVITNSIFQLTKKISAILPSPEASSQTWAKQYLPKYLPQKSQFIRKQSPVVTTSSKESFNVYTSEPQSQSLSSIPAYKQSNLRTFDPNCYIFEKNGCSKCNNRFYLDKKYTCQPVQEECEDYNEQTGFCYRCSVGYVIKDGKCNMNNPFCLLYDSSGKCSSCIYGFDLVNGNCIREQY